LYVLDAIWGVIDGHLRVSAYDDPMNKGDYTQGEQNAMRRVSAGSEVGPDMWQELFRKQLVERRQGKRALTEKGRNALSLF
jgi:ribosomal protein S19E (S16A)